MVTRRRLVVLVVVGTAAAALVGLSAAASTSVRSDTADPARASQTSAKPAAKPDTVVESPQAQQQTPGEVADYWTKTRMRDAKPMGGIVPGGSSSTAAPSGKGTPAGTTATTAPKRKQSTSKATSKPDDVVAGPSTSGNADDGWTQDEMDAAQPMGPTVDGGDGSGGASGPPGGGTGAGTP